MEYKTGPSAPLLTLNLQTKQQPQLMQRLMMSAHMQQALQLLQIPLLELDAFLEEQITINPLLELAEESGSSLNEEDEREEQEPSPDHEVLINDNDFTLLKHLEEEYSEMFNDQDPVCVKRSSEENQKKAYLEESICAETSLHEKLVEEIHETFDRLDDQLAAEILIGYFDHYGFMTTPLEEISILHQLDISHLTSLLKEIQTFEPYGVGASSIQDSLLIQLRCLKKESSLAYSIVSQYYDELLHNRLPLIQKGLNCSMEEIKYAIEHDISKLDIHPGTQFSKQKNPILVPDVTITQEEEELMVDVNREHFGQLHINSHYLKMLDQPDVPLETKTFIKQHVFSAKWLARNLHQRYSTIERIAQSLAVRQREFFIKPEGKLVPLTMKTLAEELDLHESTIARTVSNKYIASPRGLLPLRAFFTSGYVSEEGEDLSSKTVREAIVELIKSEDPQHPYSDETISGLLKKKGILCARRTIAKYRTELKIGNTTQRKKF